MRANDKKHQTESQKGILTNLKAYVDRRRLGELLVMDGLVTPTDLRQALKEQKETGLALGQIFINQNLINRRQLTFVLGRQYLLRTAAAIFFCASMVVSKGKPAYADSIGDIPAQVRLVSATEAGIPHKDMRSYPALFGTAEKRSVNIAPFTKWSDMFQRFEQQLGNAGSNQKLTEWRGNLASLQGLPLKTMADKVNSMVNQVRYIEDSKNWGKTDYWATPVEFLQRGGDCEDYAITKYTALRALGVPEERLRIAIVHDTLKNIPHAVLTVYTDEGVFILDNQNKSLVSASNAGRYRPIFSINRSAWWLHTTPGSTMVASAN